MANVDPANVDWEAYIIDYIMYNTIGQTMMDSFEGEEAIGGFALKLTLMEIPQKNLDSGVYNIESSDDSSEISGS